MLLHTIAPVYDERSKILILGSFPSVKSRESEFFYGHPRNRFWSVLAAVFEEEVPGTVSEKKAFLLEHNVALWDVIGSCEIEGSSDSSIRNAIPNDISPILSKADIRTIYVNGRTAEKYYNKYLRAVVGRDAVPLPSTSPANAGWSFERLLDAWMRIRLDFSDTK